MNETAAEFQKDLLAVLKDIADQLREIAKTAQQRELRESSSRSGYPGVNRP